MLSAPTNQEFDSDWYISEYTDVEMLGMPAQEHYQWIGKKLGRRPNPGVQQTVCLPLQPSQEVDVKWYLNEYLDVGMLGMPAQEHYEWIGKKLGRKPNSGIVA